MINSTVAIAQRLRDCLPQTPNYVGYVFSIREIIVVLQGLVSQTDMMVSLQGILDIWEHQCLRIFGDGLASAEHLNTLRNEIDRELSGTFSAYIQKKDPSCIYICGNRFSTHSLHQRINQVFSANLPTRLGDMRTLEDIRSEVEKNFQKIPRYSMSLDLVRECIHMSFNLVENHRNILMAGCNLGCRYDMVQIACWLSNAQLMTYDQERTAQIWEQKTKWENTLASSYRKASDARRLYVLYLDYSQILYQWQWEDIKLILNDEIPTSVISELFPPAEGIDDDENQGDSKLDEKSTILSRLSGLFKLVISLPLSNNLRCIFRDRPFLLKNSTIHWGYPWTSTNIHSIVSSLLNSSDWFKAFSEIQKTLIQKFWAFVYEDVQVSSEQEYCETRQRLSVSTDFILFGINCFKNIFGKKIIAINQQMDRLQSALKKIELDVKTIDAIEFLYFTRLKVNLC